MLMVSILCCVDASVCERRSDLLAFSAPANGIARNQYFVYRNSLASSGCGKATALSILFSPLNSAALPRTVVFEKQAIMDLFNSEARFGSDR